MQQLGNKQQREDQDEIPRPNTRSRLNPPQSSQGPQLSSSSGPVSRGQSPTSQFSAASQAATTPRRPQQGPRSSSRRSVVQIASQATAPTNPQAIPIDPVTLTIPDTAPVVSVDPTLLVIATTPTVTVDPVVPVSTTDVATQTFPVNIVTSTISESPDSPVNPVSLTNPTDQFQPVNMTDMTATEWINNLHNLPALRQGLVSQVIPGETVRRFPNMQETPISRKCD